MKNPVTTIKGVITLLVTLIAAIFPKLLGFNWADIEFQTAVIAAIMLVVSGVFGLIDIFKAGDKGGV